MKIDKNDVGLHKITLLANDSNESWFKCKLQIPTRL